MEGTEISAAKKRCSYRQNRMYRQLCAYINQTAILFGNILETVDKEMLSKCFLYPYSLISHIVINHCKILQKFRFY